LPAILGFLEAIVLNLIGGPVERMSAALKKISAKTYLANQQAKKFPN
jgi:hypothetical protein